MLKSLIAVGLASILITQPPQNTNDGTYYQDVEITESYEYETNEVNSVDDLVVGNIYHFDNTNGMSFTENDVLLMDKWFNIDIVSCNSANVASVSRDVPFIALYQTSCNFIWLSYSNSQYGVANNLLSFVGEFDFIYKSHEGNLPQITLISASDYLGEKTITVEPVETEGLYNLAYHFLYSRIYTNTELQGMETTLFGTTINMNMWLAHTTAIVIICLLLIVLIKFVLWLFKIVSGGMLWK